MVGIDRKKLTCFEHLLEVCKCIGLAPLEVVLGSVKKCKGGRQGYWF